MKMKMKMKTLLQTLRQTKLQTLLTSDSPYFRLYSPPKQVIMLIGTVASDAKAAPVLANSRLGIVYWNGIYDHRDIMGISLGYLWDIFGISWEYHWDIIGTSWEYHWNITSQPHSPSFTTPHSTLHNTSQTPLSVLLQR